MRNSSLRNDPDYRWKKTRRSWNSTLPVKSSKRTKQDAETDPLRRRYVQSVWLCQRCGKRKAVSCHEMASGGSRMMATRYKACWLALCESDPATGRVGCHPIVQAMELSQQLAIKKASDLERYDRELVLKIKHLAPSAVTEQEVDAWL